MEWCIAFNLITNNIGCPYRCEIYVLGSNHHTQMWIGIFGNTELRLGCESGCEKMGVEQVC